MVDWKWWVCEWIIEIGIGKWSGRKRREVRARHAFLCAAFYMIGNITKHITANGPNIIVSEQTNERAQTIPAPRPNTNRNDLQKQLSKPQTNIHTHTGRHTVQISYTSHLLLYFASIHVCDPLWKKWLAKYDWLSVIETYWFWLFSTNLVIFRNSWNE